MSSVPSPGAWKSPLGIKGLISTLALCALAQGAAAKEWGLVVGIDDYRHFKPRGETRAGQLTDLEGATNDASVIAASLRKVGVDLPDHRFLMDDRATLAAFRAGWDEITSKAAPGDTIIVTFAGHGGQEKEVREPFDEKADGKDETLMFHDFNPEKANEGRINDDQLRELLKAASQFNVIWVMDSCHSAGLERSINPLVAGMSRNGGTWDIPLDEIPDELPSGEGDDDAAELAHVTQILATASEDRVVNETAFDNVKHGALSYFFAKAIGGEADTDKNGTITRAELAGYVEDRVFTHMDGKQQPTFLPRGDSTTAFSLLKDAPKPVKAPVPVKIEGMTVRLIGPPPPGFENGCPGCTFVQDAAKITFERVTHGWKVYNATGDEVTVITGKAEAQIKRAAFLQDLNAGKNPGMAPMKIEPLQSQARQPIGAQVGWKFSPPSRLLPYLTLFNIASDGSVQYGITPPGFREDEPTDRGLTLKFSVAPPPGVDQLIAVYCKRPPLHLQSLLKQVNGRTVPAYKDMLDTLGNNSCQFGRVGLFTENKGT